MSEGLEVNTLCLAESHGWRRDEEKLCFFRVILSQCLFSQVIKMMFLGRKVE